MGHVDDRLATMTFDDIMAYMKADGWPIEPLREQTFQSSFQGELRSFQFFVHAESVYLILAVVPYQRLPVDEEEAQLLMDKLLHLNNEMTFAKFSVDEDGDVVLSVEYPMAHLDESELRDALDVLTYYANLHWREIQPMGDDPLQPRSV